MGAVISPCGQYRYRLERDFYRPGPVAAVFMVNPSTADASTNDATIRKLLGFGARLGWHKMIVGNVCAYRATDIRELRGLGRHAVGAENERHLRQIMRDADIHIAAWGPTGKLPLDLRDEWRTVDGIASLEGFNLHCWGIAKDGQPRHPLMLPYDTGLQQWTAP